MLTILLFVCSSVVVAVYVAAKGSGWPRFVVPGVVLISSAALLLAPRANITTAFPPAMAVLLAVWGVSMVQLVRKRQRREALILGTSVVGLAAIPVTAWLGTPIHPDYQKVIMGGVIATLIWYIVLPASEPGRGGEAN